MGSPEDALKSPMENEAGSKRNPSSPPKRDRPSMRPGGPGSLVGSLLSGRYRIEKLLGEGGMGAVYQVEHTHMRKRLAVKILHPEMSRLTEVVQRFEREAMAAAHIDHPNVAAATDFGKLEDGSFFLVLEFVEGVSLREVIGQGRLEIGRALHIARQIAAALQRAHTLGIVHRDLKPENVMLVERDGDKDFVKVLDFGIAKVPVGEILGDKDKGSDKKNAGPGVPVLTQLGMVYGTPEYMAPEQALGQPVDPRADLYALGILAYEMLTGLRPFDHESKVTLLGMQVTAPPPPMAAKCADANVPPEIEDLVKKLLAKEASQRFAEAKEFIDALNAVTATLVAQGRITNLPVSLPMGNPSMPHISLVGLGPPSQPNLGAAMAGAQPLAPTSLAIPSVTNHAPAAAPSVGLLDRLRENAAVRGLGQKFAALDPAHKRLTLTVAAGVVGLIVAIVLVVTVAMAVKPSAADADAGPLGSTTVSAGAGTITPDSPEVAAALATADADITRGDFEAAIEKLTPLEQGHPDRADLHAALEKAYMGSKRRGAAMNEAGLWLKADPKAVDDAKLLEDVRNAALGGDGVDAAFDLLENKLGAQGVYILYDVAYTMTGYAAAASRAKLSLAKSEVREHASPAVSVALDFRDAKGCEPRHALLERAKNEGDERMLPLLRPYQGARGCGFLGRSDCNPCMHRDRALYEALAAIEARSKKN